MVVLIGVRVTKQRLSPEEARDEVRRRIAALEPRVRQLKAERRAATKAQRLAAHACTSAEIELSQLRHYLYALASAVAGGEPLVYGDGTPVETT